MMPRAIHDVERSPFRASPLFVLAVLLASLLALNVLSAVLALLAA